MSQDDAKDEGLIGRTIAGRYRIERKIARGGMGVVYVAEHLRLKRPVVVKVLSEHLADDEKAAARFEQEALGLSKLNHPNIVTVYDFGIEEGVTYIVMEFVPGITLSQLLRQGGIMSFQRLLPLAVQIIEAIGAAHDKDVVHRDIKPANIMVVSEDDETEIVKVLDFGLARLTSSSLDITKDNLVGTVSYVAPEVVRGSRAGKEADVYALGVMFYFMLTGRKPFKAEDDIAVLYQHVHDQPIPMVDILPDAHDVPSKFIELIARCMAKSPEERPADAKALLDALAEFVTLPTQRRIPSNEFLAMQREALPDVSDSLILEPVSASIDSIELSSVALAQHPNSRWGIPLIALCVLIAGIAAVVFIADAGGESATSPTTSEAEGAIESGRGGEVTGEFEVESDAPTRPTQGSTALEEEPPTEKADDAPIGKSEASDGRTTRRKEPSKTTKESSSDSAEDREDEGVLDGEIEGRDEVEKTAESQTPSSEEKSEESEEVPTLPPENDSPGLLDVEQGSGGGLLPVD